MVEGTWQGKAVHNPKEMKMEKEGAGIQLHPSRTWLQWLDASLGPVPKASTPSQLHQGENTWVVGNIQYTNYKKPLKSNRTRPNPGSVKPFRANHFMLKD